MIKKPYLLSPGPTPVPPEVRQAGALPLIHHRTSEFSDIFGEVSENLRYIFQTARDVYTLTSSGSGAMEAAVVNILDPGDEVLVLNAGKFGDRWTRLCRSYGVEVREIKVPWGTDIPTGLLAEHLEKHPGTRAVFSTLSETSTGTVYDIEGFAGLTANTETLLVVDGISGMGAMPCPMDSWGVDVLISGSQKSFMTPPGLAFIAFSAKAWRSVETSSLPRFYFDAQAAQKALQKQTSAWTPAISLVRQLREALKIMRGIGLEGLFSHHRALADATRAGVRELGLDFLSQKPGNILTAVKTPEGQDGAHLVKVMQDRFKAHIAGAQDPHKGEFFRIGHLGFIGGFDIITALSALEMTLGALGYTNFEKGGSLKAAQAIIKENWT